MAVKTNFSNKELKKIISEYDIGEFLDFKPFKTGYVQTNILLKTIKGRFVLRYYENRNRKSVSFETDFLEYLRKHQYPCAQPIRNNNGDFIGTYKKKPYVLFSYIEGRHVKNLNDMQLHEMIKYLALFHKISKGYKPINYEHRQPRTKEFCLEAAREEAKRFKDKEKGKQRLDLVESKLKHLNLPRNLPKGVIHGDFDKANIKYRGNKLSGVLDFDDACYAFLIYDVGVVLLYWARFYEKKFDFNKARKIMKIYMNYRPLSKLEKLHVFDAVQFSALMIMSWLMYDKWKGKDLFKILAKIVDELDAIGREEFYKKIFY